MSGGSWVCVDRAVFEHEMFEGDEFSRRDAWLWLCANASWRDRAVTVNGDRIKIKRGQLVASRSFLAAAWSWSEKRVRNYLDELIAEGMIEKGQSKGRFANTITICNYEKFQSRIHGEGQQKGQSRASLGPETEQGKQINSSSGDARARFELDIDDREIRGPSGGDGEPVFVIDLGAVDMEAFHQSMEPARCRQIAEQCARDWMANRKRPASPMASVRRAIREERNASDIHEHRKTTRSGHTSATLDNRQEWQIEQDRRRSASREALKKMGILQ
jgi:hypothetical protein